MLNIFGISEWIGFISLIITVIIGIISIQYYRKQLRAAESERDKFEKLFKAENVLLDGMEALDKILQIIIEESKSNNKFSLKNIGLDLETVMPWLRYKLVTNEICSRSHIHYKGLIINPMSESVSGYINGASNVRSSFVTSSLESAENLNTLDIKNYNIEIRSYDCLPVIYGFLLNDNHLFLGFTEIKEGKISGGNTPYLYLKHDKTSILNVHYFNVFSSWFKKMWLTSNKQINIKK